MSTLLFGSLAALFLAVTFSTLFHLRWARRLPALCPLTGREGADHITLTPGASPENLAAQAWRPAWRR